MYSMITAFGAYAPERVVTNADMEKMVETSNEWILKRTGIEERRYIADGQTTIDMAENAVKNLIDRSGKDVTDVDMIILATSTAEHVIPSIASQIQNRFGIQNVGCIDVTAACAGFIYALTMGDGMVRTGNFKKVLVLGVEALTNHTDFEDRTTCILFGDGAGACLLEASDVPGFSIPIMGTEGDKGSVLYVSNSSTSINGVEVKDNNNIVQDGQKVFKWAVATMARQFKILLEKNNLSIEDIDYFVPHSANKRIVEALCKFVDFPLEKTMTSIEKFGNTSAASIPLAIFDHLQTKEIKKGSKILVLGFGGGLTYAGTILTWGADHK